LLKGVPYPPVSSWLADCRPAPDRLPVQLAQVVHGGMQMQLAPARAEAAHGELSSALAVLHLAKDRRHAEEEGVVGAATRAR
jgi:hypothetical protein